MQKRASECTSKVPFGLLRVHLDPRPRPRPPVCPSVHPSFRLSDRPPASRPSSGV